MKKRSILFTLLSIIGGFGICSGQTTIAAGNVSGSWGLAGSPYNITGHITVPADSTLNIAPGVAVVFQGHYKFNVQGRVLAIGTVSDSISFSATDTATGWWGFRYQMTSATQDTSVFQFCKVQHGKANGTSYDGMGGAFQLVDFSKMRIENCLIANNMANGAGGGICAANGSAVILNNIIRNNRGFSGGAIYCSFLTSIISGNTMTKNRVTGGASGNSGGAIFLLNSTSQISGNIISDNFAAGTAMNVGGGGIMCYGSSPLILNNSFIGNTASNGGAICCYSNANPTITDNIIDTNVAQNFGGGIFCEHSSPVIGLNDIINNRAIGGWDHGAGIACHYSSPNINNNFIDGNGYGEGIYCHWYSCPVIDNNIISNNNGSGIMADGSDSLLITNNTISGNTKRGIHIEHSTAEINNNTVSGNEYGGIYGSFSEAMISYNTVTYNTHAGGITSEDGFMLDHNIICNNQNDGYGGGVFSGSSYITISNSIICNNTAMNGGGIATTFYPKIYNCTIANNLSIDYGGGLHCQHQGDPDFKNVILYGNVSNTGFGDAVAFYFTNEASFEYCNIEGGMNVNSFYTAGAGNIGSYLNNIITDPLFVSPTAGAGTGFNGVAADWSLQVYSPCINAGTPDTTGLFIATTDLAGNPRVYADTIDIGAYEFQSMLGVGLGLTDDVDGFRVFPNPVAQNSVVEYTLETNSFIDIKVYNMLGVQLVSLANTYQQSGKHQWNFNPQRLNIEPGIYFIALSIDGKTRTKQIIVLE